jgi:CRISPR-associated protein Cmr2
MFWKRKLAAYLHDAPSKCLNLGEHEEWSAKAMSAAGLDQIKYPRIPDWEASAADRFPFPKSKPANISCAFDGVKAGFHHPLGGNDAVPCELKFEKELGGLDLLEGEDSQVQPVLARERAQGWSEMDVDRARFFAHWRLWRQWAQEKDWRFGFLPADTRIPDHTIWHHMQITSALAGGIVSEDPHAPLEVAFLKMQVGPVQDFIAAAKSTRDLWSGSYLLSWLMAAGLKHLSHHAGPDAVVFPSLWGQPLFDLHWRDCLWNQVAISNAPKVQDCWQAVKPSAEAMLTPNLPNVFLALVPARQAKELATSTAQAIRAEFMKIAEHVWTVCEEAELLETESAISKEERRHRFTDQIERFLSISWSVTEWPEDLEKSLAAGSSFGPEMPVAQAMRRVEVVRSMAEKLMPEMHRDSRYYHNNGRPEYKIKEPAKLKQRGLGWSVLLARNAWELDAVRQIREFPGTQGEWKVGTFQNKDFLTGKDAAVGGGREWSERIKRANASRVPWAKLFRTDDWIGAVTLVKRVWHLAYLKPQWDLPTRHDEFPMPNVRGIASHEPFSSDDQDELQTGEKYFAVLAFDGDQIGKWISGEKTPAVQSQLADYSDGLGQQRKGIREYFERDPAMKGFLEGQRPVSPGYHLQFSEALGNFALHCAASIVEAHDGRLIYSGGDDVLAMLPADTALQCAEALVAAFQGRAATQSVKPRIRGAKSENNGWLSAKAPGFLLSQGLRESTGKLLSNDERMIPFIVPGPRATASVGIAMAHFKSPLQDVVRAAQRAEKRAKNQLGRAAVAVTLCKRSGEISEWGCQWASGGLELYRAIAERLASKNLSAKFPHRVCQLLDVYKTVRTGLSRQDDAPDFEASSVIRLEFAFAVERQSGPAKKQENLDVLLPLLDAYLAGVQKARGDREKEPSLSQAQEWLQAITGLCTAVAFADRTRSSSDATDPETASA